LTWEARALRRLPVRAFHLLPREGTKGPKGVGPSLGIRIQRDGGVEEGTVVAGAFVMPWFAAIPYRLPGDPAWRGARILALWPDSLEAEVFRATRVRLRWN
jgi:hypothetical protein